MSKLNTASTRARLLDILLATRYGWGSLLLLAYICGHSGAASAGSVNTSLTKLTVNPGEETTLIIDLKNPQIGAPLTNVGFSTPLLLPTGMKISNPSAFSSNGCGGLSLNVAADRGSFNISGGSIGAATITTEGICTFSMKISSTTQGNSTITLPQNTVTNDQNETNANPAQIALQVNNIASPSLAVGFAPNTVSSGQLSTLTIGIKNNATIGLTGVNLTDTLPNNLEIDTSNPTTLANCGGGTLTISAPNTYTLTGGSIAVGATCNIPLKVKSNVVGVYNYQLSRNKVTNTQGLTPTNDASQTLAVQSLVASTRFASASVAIGQPNKLFIDLQNWGLINYTGVNFTSQLSSAALAFVNPNSTLVSSCGGTVTFGVDGSNKPNLKLVGGTIPAQVNSSTPGTCQISVDVSGTTAGNNYANTIAANNIKTTQLATNPVAATALFNIFVPITSSTMTVDKSFTPTTISVNGRSRLKITVNNTVPGTNLTGIGLVDTFANPLLKIANPPNASTTCTGGTVSAVAGDTDLTLAGGTLNNATTSGTTKCDIFVDVTSDTPSGSNTPYPNIIPTGAITTNQGNTNGNQASATLIVSPGLEVSQGFSPSTIAANGRSTLVVTLSNYLPYAVTNTSLTDTFAAPTTQNPPQILVDAIDNRATTCSGGTVSVAADRKSFSLAGATIPAGVNGVPGVCTFEVDITTNSLLASNSNKANILANAISSSQPGLTNNNGASATLNIRNNLDLEVVKSFTPPRVGVGGYSTTMIVVGNQTDVDFPNVTFTDNLPSGMLVANNPNATTTCANGVITIAPNRQSFTLNSQRLPKRGSNNTDFACTVQVQVISTQVTNLINTIPAGGITSTNGVKNSQSASATLDNDLSLGVTKSFTPNNVAPGEPATLQIKLLNPYNQAMTGLTFSDPFPSGLARGSGAEVNGCGGMLTFNNNILLLSGGGIPAQSDCTVTFPVQSATAGIYANVISPNGVSADGGFTNATATQDTLVVANRPTLSKSFTPSTIVPFGTSRLAITINSNNTVSDAILSQPLVDNLPVGMTVASAPNPNASGNSCKNATVVANPGDNKITILPGTKIEKKTNSTIANPGFCKIEVNVTANIGNYTNTLPSGSLQTNIGSNQAPASANLTVAGNGNLRIVKRMTGLNGGIIGRGANGTSIDLSAPSIDVDASTASKWPSNYIKGVTDGGRVLAGDIIEYTVYFLSSGDAPITDVSICDRVPTLTSFVPNGYGIGQGIALQLANGSIVNLTNSNDSDRGQIVPANSLPASCLQFPGTGDGVQVNLAKQSWTSDRRLPARFYGLMKFKVKVD